MDLVCDLRIGGIVALSVAWGTQTRLRCPRCQHFTGGAHSTVVCGCGAVNRKIVDAAHYRVESLP